jgi:hypothetical protein
VYNDLTVTSDLLHPPTIGKDTWSQIEIDIVPWQILNRRRLRPRYLHDSLKELLFPDLFDPEEKYVRSVRELWKEESRRRGEMGLPEEEGMVPATDERMSRSVPSQGDVGFKGGVWDSTDMWEQKLEQRLQEEEKTRKRKWELRGVGRPLPAALDPTGAGVWDRVSTIRRGFLNSLADVFYGFPTMQWIPTTFQVVETGWPKEMTSSRRRPRGKAGTQVSMSKARDPTQRPTLYEEDEEDGEDDAMNVDDIEQNPFTQVSKSQKLPTPMQIEEEEDDESVADDLDAEAVQAIGTQSAKKWRESESLVEAEMQGFREMMDVTPSKPGSRASQGPPDPDLGEQEEMQEDDFVGHLTQMQSRRKTAANTIDSPATASRRMDRTQDLSPEPSPTKNGLMNPYYLDSYPSTPSSVRSRSVTPRKNLFARGRVASPSTPPRPFAMGPRRSPGVSLSAPGAFDSPEKVVMTPSKLRFVSTGQALTLGDGDEEDVFVTSTARDKLLAAVRRAETDVAAEVEKNMMKSSQNRKVRTGGGNQNEELAPLAQTRFASDSPPPPRLPIPSPLSPMLTPTVSPRKVPSTSILKRRRPDDDPVDVTGISQLEPTFVPTQAKRARFAPVPDQEEEIEFELEPTLVSQIGTTPTLTSSTPSKRASDTASTDSGVGIRTNQDSGSTSETQGSVNDEPEPNVFRFAIPPPSSKYVESSIRSFGEQDIVYQKPFFSLRQDLPSTKSTYGTRTFQLKTNGLENAPEFQFERATADARLRSRPRGRPDLSHIRTWQYRARPPSRKETARWLETEVEALQAGKHKPFKRAMTQCLYHLW